MKKLLRVVRTLFLFSVALGLVVLAGFPLLHTELALPSALAGVSTFALALV
jgi:hypothetical protein